MWLRLHGFRTAPRSTPMHVLMKPQRSKPARLEDYTGLFCTWEGGFKVWGWADGSCWLLLDGDR